MVDLWPGKGLQKSNPGNLNTEPQIFHPAVFRTRCPLIVVLLTISLDDTMTVLLFTVRIFIFHC